MFLTFIFHLVSKGSVKHEYNEEVDLKYAAWQTLNPKEQIFCSIQVTLVSLVLVSAGVAPYLAQEYFQFQYPFPLFFFFLFQ